MSIPFLFTSVKFNGQYHTDAGVLCNYPIHLANRENFLGFLLDKKSTPNVKISTFEQYIQQVINTFQKKVSSNIIEHKDTLKINTGDYINLVDFNITKQDKLALIEIGQEAMEKYKIL